MSLWSRKDRELEALKEAIESCQDALSALRNRIRTCQSVIALQRQEIDKLKRAWERHLADVTSLPVASDESDDSADDPRLFVPQRGRNGQ
jgi:chromosome segregation ATPase